MSNTNLFLVDSNPSSKFTFSWAPSHAFYSGGVVFFIPAIPHVFFLGALPQVFNPIVCTVAVNVIKHFGERAMEQEPD